MVDKKQSCKERIEGKLAGRLADMRLHLKALNTPLEMTCAELDALDIHTDEEVEKAALEIIRAYPTGYSRSIVHRIEISWGGPQDYFEVWTDAEAPCNINRITYHFLDWLDGAQLELKGRDFEDAEEWLAWQLPE